jgi:hypothetical protein
MIKTISTVGKEHIKWNPNRFNTTEKKKNILKEIDRDESHSLKQIHHLYFSNLAYNINQDAKEPLFQRGFFLSVPPRPFFLLHTSFF